MTSRKVLTPKKIAAIAAAAVTAVVTTYGAIHSSGAHAEPADVATLHADFREFTKKVDGWREADIAWRQNIGERVARLEATRK
jgi:hypothetical protein